MPSYIANEIERWKTTGYGIDPNQVGMRHYRGDPECLCNWCVGTPILITEPPTLPEPAPTRFIDTVFIKTRKPHERFL